MLSSILMDDRMITHGSGSFFVDATFWSRFQDIVVIGDSFYAAGPIVAVSGICSSRSQGDPRGHKVDGMIGSRWIKDLLHQRPKR